MNCSTRLRDALARVSEAASYLDEKCSLAPSERVQYAEQFLSLCQHSEQPDYDDEEKCDFEAPLDAEFIVRAIERVFGVAVSVRDVVASCGTPRRRRRIHSDP
jgi:hypothetical protein